MKSLTPMPLNKETTRVFFTKERVIIIACFLLAFTFWFVVKLSKEYRTSSDLQIVWEIADTLSWASPPPSKILVTYEGEGWSLFGTAKNKIVLETNDLPIGETLLNRREILNRLERHFPSNTQIVDFTPDHFVLQIDHNSQKMLWVKPMVSPKLEPGLVLQGETTASPDSVWVAGPRQILEKLTFIQTETWQPNFQKTQTLTGTLNLLNETQTLSFRPTEVTLSLTAEQVTEKSFFVPIELLNTKDSVRVFPDKIKITFAVPLSEFDNIKPNDFQLVADFSTVKIGSKNNTLPIQIKKQPSLISNLHFRAKSIEFFIKKE